MSKVLIDREVVEQVVDAAFSTYCSQHLGKLVPALRAALEQPGAEPVAWTSMGQIRFTPPTSDVETYKPLYTAPQPAQQAVPRDRIREIFMEAGFTIKEGQTDLKPYVYEAAYALLNEAAQPARQEPECYRWEEYGKWAKGWGWDTCETEYDPRTPEKAEYHKGTDFDGPSVRNFRALYTAPQPAQQAVGPSVQEAVLSALIPYRKSYELMYRMANNAGDDVRAPIYHSISVDIQQNMIPAVIRELAAASKPAQQPANT